MHWWWAGHRGCYGSYQAFDVNVPLLNTLADGYGVVLATPIAQLSQLMGSNLIIGDMVSIMGSIGPGLSMGVLNDGLAASKYRPCPLLVKYVEVRWLGQRTKLGFYAPTADLAEAELDGFEEKWAGKYASIAPAWRRAWAEVIPFFGFDPAIRKIIYTTNAIESLNRVIRKSIKTRGSFPTDEAATKLIYLAIRKFEKDGRNVREWFASRNQFAIMFGERFDA